MIAGYNVYQAHSETEGMSELALANVEAFGEMKKNESSELVLANVEALAAGEGVGITCSQSCRDGIGLCWTEDSSDPMYCERSANPSNRCSCLR